MHVWLVHTLQHVRGPLDYVSVELSTNSIPVRRHRRPNKKKIFTNLYHLLSMTFNDVVAERKLPKTHLLILHLL